jgi:hypothetical protein
MPVSLSNDLYDKHGYTVSFSGRGASYPQLLAKPDILQWGKTIKNTVTVKLSVDFILGVKIYTLDREDRVSGETSVTVLHSSEKSRDREENDTGTEREREREQQRENKTVNAKRMLGTSPRL